jgi:hypothetical protein
MTAISIDEHFGKRRVERRFLHEGLASSAAFHLFVSQSGSHWAIWSGWPFMFKATGTDVPVADPTVLLTPDPAVSVVLLTALPAVPVALFTALPAWEVPGLRSVLDSGIG